MATYKIKTKRYIRKYTAAEKLPVSAALIDAQRVVDELCKVPWEQASATTSTITSHDESELDSNVSNRDRFDAALFCADHANGAHRAYANAACYKIQFPTGTAGKKLTSLKVRVTSDAYNAAGARIALVTNSTGVIPTSCAECRGEGSGGVHAAGVAPQTIQTVGGQRYGYPTIADCIFNVSPGEGEYALPEGGLTLGSYLYVFVLMENYNSVRGNWLEGSSCIVNQIEIVTDSAITGWTDGETYDLSGHAERSFVVVSGGVMNAMPSGDNGIRALTIQRTGDDFVLDRVVTGTGLYSRDKVVGIRVIDVTSTDSIFRTPFVSSLAENVRVFPATGYLVSGNQTAQLALGTIVGDFADGTFTDLPGLFIYKINNGVFRLIKLNQSLQEHTAGQYTTALANLKAKIQEAGGIGCAGIVSDFGSSPKSWRLSLVPKNKSASLQGVVAENIQIGFSGDYWDSEISNLIVYDSTFAEYHDVFCIPYRGAIGSWTQTCDAYFDHDSGSKTITALCAREGGLDGRSVSYVGAVTSIRPVNFTTAPKTPAFIVSGQLESVGGVECSNCAIVRFPNFGAAQVTVPSCDGEISPDSYRGFAVSCPVTFTPNVSTFYVTGGFRRLGSHDVVIAAKVSGGSLGQIDLKEGTRPPEYFLVSNAAGSDSMAVWIDDNGTVEGEESAVDVWKTPKTAVTDAQSAFGLRRLYADLYGGALQAATVPATARPGAAFVVRGDEITVKTADGDVAAKCWNMSASVLVVPFSCPREFLASRVRLDWPSVAATEGAKVTVWLLRGEYLRAYPTSYPKGLFTGEAKSVAGWELVGTVEPTGGSAGAATLDVDPIEDDVATLMFVAFVGQDDFNPSADMTLPRGVGSLNVNAVAGTATGLDGGFRPDITLIG